MKRSFLLIIFLALVIALPGCGKKDKPDKKVMYKLASSLTKLASAVESTVRYKQKSLPPGVSDKELLAIATKHDPKLLEPFKDYVLKVLQKDKHGIVLVCTKNGKQGLLEDAGCSREMDKHLWESSSSCKFTLTPGKVCER